MDGCIYEGNIQPDSAIIDFLINVVFIPHELRHGELRELLLYAHLRLNITKVVGFEERPFLRGILRAVASSAAVALGRSARRAEILDEFLTLGQLLLVEVQNRADTLQRKRQSHVRRPHHRASPGRRVEVFARRHSEMPGKTDPLKVGVEGKLQHVLIGKRGGNVCRYFFAECQIDHMDFAAVNGITEEQNLEVRVFRVFVDTALAEVGAAVCFDIKTYGFQELSPRIAVKGGRIAPTAHGG